MPPCPALSVVGVGQKKNYFFVVSFHIALSFGNTSFYVFISANRSSMAVNRLSKSSISLCRTIKSITSLAASRLSLAFLVFSKPTMDYKLGDVYLFFKRKNNNRPFYFSSPAPQFYSVICLPLASASCLAVAFRRRWKLSFSEAGSPAPRSFLFLNE